MTQYLDITEIQNLNIDINTSCNAACPGCARQYGGLYKNKLVPQNQHMQLSTWKKIIDEIGSQLQIIVMKK